MTLSQKRVHAKDCDDCDSKEGYIHIINKELEFVGNLDEKQKARLLDISERCPVQKTLLNEIKIETTMKE